MDSSVLLITSALWAAPTLFLGTVLVRQGRRREVFPLLLVMCGTYLGFYASHMRLEWLVLPAVGLMLAAGAVRFADERRAREQDEELLTRTPRP